VPDHNCNLYFFLLERERDSRFFGGRVKWGGDWVLNAGFQVRYCLNHISRRGALKEYFLFYKREKLELLKFTQQVKGELGLESSSLSQEIGLR
jgi:hypothetical protein